MGEVKVLRYPYSADAKMRDCAIKLNQGCAAPEEIIECYTYSVRIQCSGGGVGDIATAMNIICIAVVISC